MKSREYSGNRRIEELAGTFGTMDLMVFYRDGPENHDLRIGRDIWCWLRYRSH